MADFDSPWKESLELYFEPAMALFFPIRMRMGVCGTNFRW